MRFGASVAVVLVMVAGSWPLFGTGAPEGTAAGTVAVVKTGKYGESPALAELVRAGKLPPVDKRLPDEPAVIDVVDQIGTYGGDLRRAWLGPPDANGINKLMGELIVRFDPKDPSRVIPNIAKGWDITDEGRTYTFHLRQGMKWSDGQPFTVDDVMFYWEDIQLNKELTAQSPSWLVIGGKNATVERVDDDSFRFRFAEPYGLFLVNFAHYGKGYFYRCKHYLKDFHPRYTPKEELDKKVKEAGYKSWVELFNSKLANDVWMITPGHPVVLAWQPATAPTAARFVMERNPYFWKVDPSGNQLPYIDRVVNDLAASGEIINAKAVAGEIDFQNRRLSLENYTLFKKNGDIGNYRVMDKWVSARGAEPLILPNLTHKDLVKRKIYQDDRFRKALSLAIKRDEVNDVGYSGLGEPRQASIVSGGVGYSAEWEKAYAEYDPQKANRLLDEMGLNGRDSAGFRLRPDGQTLSVLIEYGAGYVVPDAVAVLLKGYWEAIGIKVAIKSYETTLITQRTVGNDQDIYLHIMDTVGNFLANPHRMVPLTERWDSWGSEWGRWYATKGKSGVEPPEDVKSMQQLWEKILTTTQEAERAKLIEKLVGFHVKNLFQIGCVGEVPYMTIASKDLGNVPTSIVVDDVTQNNVLANPQQFYWKKKK